jgi:hypothetical protein
MVSGIIEKIPNTFMFISIPALVTPNYLDGSLQNLYCLPISQDIENYCRNLLKKRDLLILGFDHETTDDIKFQIIELNKENTGWVSMEWQMNDSLFYFAKVEKCDFPLSRAVSDLIKGLEKLKARE